MKLHFDSNHAFQLDAMAVLTDIFDGQPQGAPEYAVLNMGDWGDIFAGHERTELGVGNRLLLAEHKLLANAHNVQTRSDIEVAWVAQPLIKPKGHSKKKRTFGEVTFQYADRGEGHFAGLLPVADGASSGVAPLH